MTHHLLITITVDLPAEQLNGQKRHVREWQKGNLPSFTYEVEGQIPLECESRKMNVGKIYLRMSIIQKHICHKAVGLAGRYWMTKDINDELRERLEVRRSVGTNTEAHKRLNEEVSL